MTTDTEPPRPSQSGAARAMLRGAAVPALGVSVICVAVATWLRGTPGLWGSLLGVTLVFAFFATSLVVLGRVRAAEPGVALLVALGLYTMKVVALAVAFVVIGSAGWLGDPLHRGSLGLTIIVCTLTWTTTQVVAAVRHRQPLYDLPAGS